MQNKVKPISFSRCECCPFSPVCHLKDRGDTFIDLTCPMGREIPAAFASQILTGKVPMPDGLRKQAGKMVSKTPLYPLN